MAANVNRAPKQWCLTKQETLNSFENWKQNLLYTLSLDPVFAPFLIEGTTWEKKSRTTPLRGFRDDGDNVAAARRRTAQQKVNQLELMLGQIANYCPVISRNTIVRNSTSVEGIWQAIRLHFGFQSTGAQLIDFVDIHLETDERPEDLYQRLMAFTEDSLLKAAGLTHHGIALNEDEDLSPSLENFIVLTWLRLIHTDLPRLIKQRYGTELRTRTLASIKPEISQALDSLLSEIRAADDAKIMRAAASSHTFSGTAPRQPPFSANKMPMRLGPREKSCPLCTQAGRQNNTHFLSSCKYLPEQDRRFMLKARQIVSVLDDEPVDSVTYQECSDEEHLPPVCHEPTQPHTARAVQVRQSPYIDTFYKHHHARIILDTGATCNMIRLSAARRLGAHMAPSSQSAHQADGSSPMKVVGETRLTFHRGANKFQFEGLVVEDLDVDILAGTPFMSSNDISVRPAKRLITLADGAVFSYGSNDTELARNAVRRTITLRAPPSPTTIWPGEFLEISLPPDAPSDAAYAMEPRLDSHMSKGDAMHGWPHPGVIPSVAGRIRIPNLSDEPHVLKRHQHFCQVDPLSASFIPSQTPDIMPIARHLPQRPAYVQHSRGVQVDPDNLLPPGFIDMFHSVLDQYDVVFDPAIPGYNGAVGPFEARVNMGPVEPPQRKGRLPLYGRDKLTELQQKFDELEQLGVFRRPEDVGVSVEYLNPSFLVRKQSGGYRLVTAFADVGRYSKPQPSLMPDVDSTLRQVAQWRHLIATDLTNAFYQIPLSCDSMKYCGVVTPFRGVRVYARSAMGMPGSETALEELMCRVLGDLLQAGVVAKLADDLYCGGNSPEELLDNWTSVLCALNRCNLRLSASKTVINPRSTNILGWVWTQGKLSPSPHRVSTLAACEPPRSVGGMRSFIGAVKVMARVIKHCSALLAPLDNAIAGKTSQDNVEWTEELHYAFSKVKECLSSGRSIVLPRPDDQLWIVSDGAVRRPGIAATLYVMRKDKLALAGFFSAKLRDHQLTWLPCEVEALAIAAAVKHFAPYIIQSSNKACVLTDSKPCVQAYEKLCRGEFSASPRVSTFLSTASRFHVSIRHVAGAAILPSDFASRNPPDCTDMACQVCSFVQRTQDSVVRLLSSDDILAGRARLPFTSRAAWRSLQSECPDLRRTHAHLTQGTRPSKKLTNIKDVKRYLSMASIASDGLLIVRREEPLSPCRECIIVPRQVLDGLVTALHLQLSHPSANQLRKTISRYFFALDLDKAVRRTTEGCHACAALRHKPQVVIEQSSSAPPAVVGVSFAADIMKRARQLVLVLRECVTSYTVSMLVDDESSQTLRDGLIRLCVELRPLDGPFAVIRTDPAPAFKALATDSLLAQHRISLELGRAKNPNKNPVAEKAIQELGEELLRQQPRGGPISPRLLAVATACLNSRLRSRGLSAREMWTQRDQFTCDQLPLADEELIRLQHGERVKNHSHSEQSKAPHGMTLAPPSVEVGDLVYLHGDRNKACSRDRYLVVSVEGLWCGLRKFAGSQLRDFTYRVKLSDCYKVPVAGPDTVRPSVDGDASDEDCPLPPDVPRVVPPQAPTIPPEIASVPTPAGPGGPCPILGWQSPADAALPEDRGSPCADPVGVPSSPRRGARLRRPPPRLSDYVMDF